MQERIIYIPTHHIERTETLAKPLVKAKRRSTHITAEAVKNKLLGASLIAIGILSAKLTGDGTATVMMLMIGLPAIIAK